MYGEVFSFDRHFVGRRYMSIRELPAFDGGEIAYMIEEGFQISPAYFLWILYPQGACRCIPGIGQGWDILLGQLVVVLFKIILIHQYFPAYLDHLDTICGKSCRQWYGPYLPDIGRDLIAGDTVAPGDAPQQ